MVLDGCWSMLFLNVVQYSYRIMGNLKDSTLYYQDDRNLARHHPLRVESSPGKWVRRAVLSIY